MSCLIDTKTPGGEVSYMMTSLYPGYDLKQFQELAPKKWEQVNLELKIQFSSVAQSCLTFCDPNESQHARPPSPSPTPGVHPNPCPLSW